LSVEAGVEHEFIGLHVCFFHSLSDMAPWLNLVSAVVDRPVPATRFNDWDRAISLNVVESAGDRSPAFEETFDPMPCGFHFQVIGCVEHVPESVATYGQFTAGQFTAPSLVQGRR
jgi:hypothetical protein